MSTTEKSKTLSRNGKGSGVDEMHPVDDVDEPGHVFDPINLRDRVVIKLLFEQVVTIEQIEEAWQRWKSFQKDDKSVDLWRVLADGPDLDQDRVMAEAADIYAFKKNPFTKSDILSFMSKLGDRFDKEQWRQFSRLKVLPAATTLDAAGGNVQWSFITHDPLRAEVNQLVRSLKLDRHEICFAPHSLIVELIEEGLNSKNEYLEMLQDGIATDLGMSFEQKKQGNKVDEDQLVAEMNRSKLVNLFEAMLIEAVRKGVSDIHLFPTAQKKVEIHFRIDGDLECWHIEDRIHPEAFLAVVKDNVMNVDRFARDEAQDGFIQRNIDDTDIRFRVSILPLASANHDLRSESIVIRVLDDRKVILDLKAIGLQKLAYERFQHAIRQPYGMVILTGPTGSGKTTTLYASLHQVVSPKRNVLTVEDPVEYILPGVRQIKLSHKLDLEGALRSILRHDPDIVMVGEMRDRQTAELAIKLANTGHLTFSTLHTNDAPSAVSRLYKMGVEPFLIAYAINLVVAQRLIRRLCPKCKRVEDNKQPVMLERLGFTLEDIEKVTFYKAGEDSECTTCRGQGYKGRRAITETMLFSNDIRAEIVTAKEMINEDKLRQIAKKEGMMTLQDSARLRVLEGETSVQEMMRVVFTDM